MNPAILVREWAEGNAPGTLRFAKSSRACEDSVGHFHTEEHGVKEACGTRALLIHNLRAQLNQHFGDVDFDRTHFIARTAKRRGEG